jgi:murein L,D-transpeptidase YcbB/YkuD
MSSRLIAWCLLCTSLTGVSIYSTPVLAAEPQTLEAPAKAQGDMGLSLPAQTLSADESNGTQLAATIDEEVRRQALRTLIAERTLKGADRKDDQAAVSAFYKQRSFQPLWTVGGLPNEQAQAALRHLNNAGLDGLDPADYPQPALAGFTQAEEAAKADLTLTNSLLTYARHLSSGRVSYTRVSGSILYPPSTVSLSQILSQLEASKDIDATLQAFAPPQAGYKALKAKLATELASPSEAKRGAAISNKDLLIANMERWRWLPRNLGHSYVVVNIPQYTLQLMNNGKPVWGTKVVVGKPGDMATPLLSETMKYLTINPTWNVPPSIIRNEYLPALERDSGALERIGLKVGRNHDGSVRVYQPPGPKNALGRIRFNFPNPFLVYQHDTPNKNLFAQDKRALSHGCMRVQNPDKYAEALLSVSQPEEKLTAARIRDLYGDDERTIPLRTPIPVHITYQTATLDEGGALVRRDDIYGLDAAILRLMRGAERAVADKAIPRNYESSSTPVNARLPNSERDSQQRLRTAGNQRWNEVQQIPATFFDRAVGVW